MSGGRRLTVAMLAVALAGCGDGPLAEDAGPAPPVSSSAPSSAASTAATATDRPETSPLPVVVLLPRQLHGVELHTFVVGQDIVARLLAELDAAPSELEIAYASEHGTRFLQLYALRVPGFDGAALLNAFSAAAYDPADGKVDRAEEEIAGKRVTVIKQPSTADRVGTFYAYALGDVLLVAQGFDRQTVDDGLAALP